MTIKVTLELWLTTDEAGAKPFDLPLNTVVTVFFPRWITKSRAESATPKKTKMKMVPRLFVKTRQTISFFLVTLVPTQRS